MTMRYPAILATALLVTWAAAAQADTIRTAGGIGVNGTIVDMDADSLIVQGESGKRSIPLAEVSRIECEKILELTRAEAALFAARAGGPKTTANFDLAEKMYQGLASKDGSPPWLLLLTRWRLCQVHGESGHVPQALDDFLALAKAQPKLAAKVKLPKPHEGDKANADMLTKVDAAIKAAGNQPQVAELKNFRTFLSLSTGDASAGDGMGELDKMRKSDDPKTRDAAASKQIDMLLVGGKIEDAEKILTEMGAVWQTQNPSAMAYWQARVLEAQKSYLPAALQFMRVAVTYPTADRNRTADALCRAGQAMEKGGKSPVAEITTVYQEAVTKYPGTPGADQAKKELARLSAAPAAKK
jgi:hypothetical protein